MYNPKYEIVINCKAIIAHGYGILNLIEEPLSFRNSELQWHLDLIDKLSNVVKLLCSQLKQEPVGMIESNFLGKARYIKLNYKRELESGGASGKLVRPVVEELNDTFDEFLKALNQKYNTSYMDDLLS